MNTSPDFYAQATQRNIGLLSEEEQDILKNSTVAIAGMGAVGGHYLLALARLGVGGFHIADPDFFEVSNLHRQAGAYVNTLGKSKAATMAEMVRNIQPGVRLKVYEEALTEKNVNEFLSGTNLLLDGIDFFQVDARRTLFVEARKQNLYGISSGPIGRGASLHIFDPKGLSFDDFFGIHENMTRAERIASFGLGLLPGLGTASSVDRSRVNAQTEKGPALISSVHLCTALATTEVMRILLKQGAPKCVPQSFYFDPSNHQVVTTNARRNRLRDRVVRWFALRRFPGLMSLHKTEQLERLKPSVTQ